MKTEKRNQRRREEGGRETGLGEDEKEKKRR